MAELEEVATYVQRELPNQLATGEEVTDAWMKKRFNQTAAGLRSLKKWILTPKSDTLSQLTERIASSLAHVAVGTWDGLERTEPEKLSTAERGQSRLRVVLRAILTGTIPLLVLFAIQQTSLAITGEIANYLKVALVVWAALPLLALVDPSYRDKIASLKDIVSMLTPLGRT